MIADKTLTLLSQMAGQPVDLGEARAIFAQLNAAEGYGPGAMVTNLVEILQLRYSAIASDEQSQMVFSDILARDRYTGYYIHAALRNLYLDFALSHAVLPKQDRRNFLILGDYMNLSSVNEAIGRVATNDVMAIICGIYLDAMTRAGVVNWLYHRSMGDEVTFIVIDTPEEKVTAGLDDAKRITAEFVQSLGLERLRHKKYRNQRGMGLVTAYVALDDKSDHRNLKQQLDDAIRLSKKTDVKRRWFGLGLPAVEPDQYHNRSSEQRIDRALNKFRAYRNTAQFSADIDAMVGTRDPLKPAKNLLLGRAIAWPRDDRIDYLRHHHDDSKIMVRADIYNLGGLNAVFGHDGADHVKAHLIRILYATIAAAFPGEPKIFDCGGGIIDIVIDAMPDEHLHQLIQDIQSAIHHQLLSLTVADYAATHGLSFSGAGNITLVNLPHPRQENQGTGLVMASHPVESRRLLPEIIERVDKITHRTKMHDFAYLWRDGTNHVFGLPLNREAVPMMIGADRRNPGLHYLPFTDALRHYLSEEDLPAIFERPVGQICETLFGTDMQAVLGFKKAIRMLQDKEIGDETIAAITSYGDMNAMLVANELPPLSVVSTQNRPAFVNNERPAFKTMALAQKLENLPRTLTELILQAQASFRTLKIMQPHGHLSPEQALLVLADEISSGTRLKAGHDVPDEDITESMYKLARLLDSTAAALDRELPNGMRLALSAFSFDILQNLAGSLTNAGELFLAQKFHAYVQSQPDPAMNRLAALKLLNQEIATLMDKFAKKQLVDRHNTKQLHDRLNMLMQVLFAKCREAA